VTLCKLAIWRGLRGVFDLIENLRRMIGETIVSLPVNTDIAVLRLRVQVGCALNAANYCERLGLGEPAFLQ